MHTVPRFDPPSERFGGLQIGEANLPHEASNIPRSRDREVAENDPIVTHENHSASLALQAS